MTAHKTVGIAFAAVFAFASGAFADDAADARALIEKAYKAHGGDKAAAHKVFSVSSKGTIFAGGMEIPYAGTNTSDDAKRHRVELTLEIMGNSVAFVNVFNGEAGWIKVGGQIMEMTAAQLKEAKAQTYAARVGTLAPLLKETGFTLSVIGEEKVGDRTVVGVRVARDGQRDIRMYFDKETRLTQRTETTVIPEGGSTEVDQVTVFTEYQEADGVKYPGRINMTQDGKKLLEGEVTAYKRLDKAEESWFTKPE